MISKRHYNSTLFFLFLIFFSCNNQHQNKDIDRESLLLDSIAFLYYKGDFDRSIEMGQNFILRYPNNDKGFHLLSSSYLGNKNYRLAVFYANKALQINPSNYAALTNKGIVLDNQERFEEASFFYEKSLEINDHLFQTYSNYMINRIKVNDFTRAVELGEKAVELGDNIWDKAHLCLAYHELGQIEKRDSLLEILRILNFEKLSNLEEIIDN